jgi:hypothetical protein
MRRWPALLVLLLAACQSNPPPAPKPRYDIWLAPLDLAAGQLGTPRNITQRDGYDNQPAFLPDGSALLYVSDRSGSTDVYRYELGSGSTQQLTQTVEAEYSPTPRADGRFSVIRVATPNAQGTDGTNPPVWLYSEQGQAQRPLSAALAVGYHAWVGERLALFMVGDPAQQRPHRLVLEGPSGAAPQLLSSAPGTRLAVTPDGLSLSFVDKSNPQRWVLAAAGPGDGSPRELLALPPGPADPKPGDRGEDFAWLPDGSLLLVQGRQLLRWDGHPGSGWAPFSAPLELGGPIVRLAVSRDGRQIALVVMRP